jgi:hypothetical protein
MLSLAKLAGTNQRYYLDQAGGRVDHAGSVSSGAEDYYLGGPEAAGRWGRVGVLRQWTSIHRDELVANWERTEVPEPPTPIAPLP